ncbi:cell division protein ZapA [Chitinivibrio alkaliphilus]|uniref:cell division protein ZapA n=1 Tax=Chitinivibrio alkaliphilus TaxID=1505232 RepID=UPI00138AF3D9
MQNTNVTIRIDNKEYTIRGDIDAERLKAAVELLNNRIDAYKKRAIAMSCVPSSWLLLVLPWNEMMEQSLRPI